VEDLEVKHSFWHGRKVFLTGHTGFKGSWACLALQLLGARVTGYALAPATQPNLFETARIGADMHSVIDDVRDSGALAGAMQRAQPEIVIHMAAQPLVRYSYSHPVETYATNVMGTVHLLEAVRALPSVRAVLVITSDKCYENREWLWGYREDEAMGGIDPYSSSKGCAELVTAAYRRSFFQASRDAAGVATCRAGNVIGGGDWASDRLIPDIVQAFEKGLPAVIRHPNAIRPWQHVLDAVSGYFSLAEALVESGPAFAQAWNFGPAPSDTRTVRWIVERMVSQWGRGVGWEPDPGAQVHEAGILTLDSAKARTRLSWEPRWMLETALDRIIAWHKAHAAGDDMRAFTIKQIEEYLA
jgi:CDP-glucose 4,6-dehydratase